MESGDVSFDYYKTILYNDDLKGLDGDGGDGDKDKTDHSVPDERGQPVSERADRQASLHLLQMRDEVIIVNVCGSIMVVTILTNFS